MNCQNKREEKYVRWNELLKVHQVDYQLLINDYLFNLYKQIGREGNTTEGIERLNRAREVLKFTNSLLIYLDSLENEIKKIPEKNLQKLMIGEKLEGKAYKLQSKLQAFQIWLIENNSDLYVEKPDFQRIMPDNRQLALYKKTQYEKLNFIESNFKSISKNQLLSSILNIRFQILFCVDDVLKKLGCKTQYDLYSWIYPVPTAIPKAEYITKDSDYQAIMFFGTPSYKRFYIMYDDKIIQPKEYSSTHNIQFTAIGEGEKSWQAEIKIKRSSPFKDTIILISHKYYVIPK
jgi:hypothetical protein